MTFMKDQYSYAGNLTSGVVPTKCSALEVRVNIVV